MSNLLEIYNENFGYSVATNGNYIAVGNPNSKPYTCDEGFSRIGEVSIYGRNNFSKNYNLIKKYRSKTSFEKQYIDAYYTEQSSSLLLTSSFVTELSNGLENDENYLFNSCSFLILEDGTRVILQNSYGKSLSMSDNFLAIGDPYYSELYNEVYYTGASVDIFKVSDFDRTVTCKTEDFSLSDIPLCSITGSYSEGFGKSVSISNNYVAVGRVDANNNEGRVNVYKYNSEICGFELQSILSSSDSSQRHFGHSISIDKQSENKIAIGTLSVSSSLVHIFEKSENSWYLKQTLTQDTSSQWLCPSNISTVNFLPAEEQIRTGYGYSVAINSNILIVGAPKDLVYYEFEGSSKLRQRGAFYFYYYSTSSKEYVLGCKLYGDKNVFKDNLLGYSVDISNNHFLIGSPKPYFPFSSLYLSQSVDRYNDVFGINDFGESTYNGQVLLYSWIENPICLRGENIFAPVLDTLISYRKKIGESFTAYGSSVSVSDSNLVVGSPALLNNDFYLSTPYVAEESSSVTGECLDKEEDVVFFVLEDEICNCDADSINNDCTDYVIYKIDQKPATNIFGKSFIYDFNDLQTNALIGNVFYNNNKIIVYNSGSILCDLLKNPSNNLDGYVYGSYQSQVTLNEKQYICTVEPGEFNVSTNPTSILNLDFEYAILNKQTFDFKNLDIILRYINFKITNSKKESWWDVLVSGDVEESIFEYYKSSTSNFDQNQLTDELICILSKKDFDINKDGIIDYSDAFLLWRYFIQTLKIDNFKRYISPISKRNNYDDIIRFLDLKTGKGLKPQINSQFLQYKLSSSMDPTGSYLAPYITSVGLYSGADLVAIAKLANPIKNNLQIPINIVTKWDI